MKTGLKLALTLCTALMATACASTATGSKQSVLQTQSSPSTLQVAPPEGGLLAVVRYPAVVDVDAQDAYREAYANSPIGGSVSASKASSVEAQNMADSTIVKSNYFALSLFKELAARLPEHTVLLSPHSVKLASDGSLTSEPITKAESLPSVVTIDFATYTFPDTDKMMGSAPLTFGDLITPLVTVRTDARAAPAVQGTLLASKPLQSVAAGAGFKTTQADLVAMESGDFNAGAPELDFVSYISKDQRRTLPTQGLSLDNGTHSVQTLPVEKLKLDRTALIMLQGDTTGEADPLKNVFSKPFADKIVGIINDTNIEKATMIQRAAAIADYDPSLAALTFLGSPQADYQARYNYAERLLDAERKYLSVQSLRLFDGIHNGEMGAQVRDMIKAEYGILERRRELARKQNQATAMAILGAVAAGGMIASGGGSSSDECADLPPRQYEECRYRQRQRDRQRQYRDRIATDALINASIFAGTQAAAYGRESKAVGQNYVTSIMPALEQQTSVQVNLIDSNETITAIRFEDLQEKLQGLYDQNQRALETVATRCAYSHDGVSKTGTWMGVCENGLANGTGVGVLRDASGDAIEYYGYAENGQPHGPGFMIVHERNGTYALEGNFTRGLADGPIRVSKAGKADQVRSFRAGKDVGSAASTTPIASPFAGRRNGA